MIDLDMQEKCGGKSYQPSGRDGGPVLGPSWFDGVGGPVISSIYWGSMIE